MRLLTVTLYLGLLQVFLLFNIQSTEAAGNDVDTIANRSKRDADADWLRRLYNAKRNTRELEKSEREAARRGRVPEDTKRLSRFLSSNRGITSAGKSAKTQLDFVKELLEEWRRKNGKHANIADFFRQLNNQARQPDSHRQILRRDHTPRRGDSHGSSSKSSKSSKSTSSSSSSRRFRDEEEELETCPFRPVYCPESSWRYRTFDGTCNNLVAGRTQWGGKDRAQERMMLADFADDIGAPRVAKSGRELPSARVVSNKIFKMDSSESATNTAMFMTFGQFLDHDITHTPGSTVFNNETGKNDPVFCGDDNCGIPGVAGKDCFGIPMPSNDPHQTGAGCMYFARSEAFLDDDCTIGQRQVANAITAWTDCSHVYGSSRREANDLREIDPYRGRLRMSTHPMDPSLQDFLPYEDNADSECTGVDDVVRCFKSGDVRQNEQVGLTSLHTVFARLHNYVEEQLFKQLKRPATGRRLFLLTRKIVIGIWQHIVYNEYLPVVLGEKAMREFDLEVESKGHYKGYDDKVRGDILTVFSTVAFRFGHTLVPDMMTYADDKYIPEQERQLSEVFFNPSTLYHCPVSGMSGIDAVVNGMICAHAEKYDRSFSNQIKLSLFTDSPPRGHGFDLPALNIQRGRDHGIKGYVHWLVRLGLEKDKSHWSFSDLTDIDSKSREEFSKVYEHPEDIDLFAAGVAETPVEGGTVGPTFAKIIGKQFQKLKEGDRFYYENEHRYGFDDDQLAEIRKYTLAKVLCQTLDHVDRIQPYVLLQASDKLSSSFDKHRYRYIYNKFLKYNHRVDCNELPDPDFSVFLNFGRNESLPNKTRSSSSKSKSSKSKSSKSKSSKSKSSKSKSSKTKSKKSGGGSRGRGFLSRAREHLSRIISSSFRRH